LTLRSLQQEKPDRLRRRVVKSLLTGVALIFTGLWQRVRAADAALWPRDAFAQKTDSEAIRLLFGKQAEVSDQIKLDAPEIAENGAVVPVSVATTLPDVTAITFVVAQNPFPLAASYKIPAGTLAMVSNRLKMAKTGNVIALVESGGKLYSASKEVKVTIGGCGG